MNCTKNYPYKNILIVNIILYFIENKKETMNIIHFENSSNKGITTNPESGEPEINLTVQGFYPTISTKKFLSQGKIILFVCAIICLQTIHYCYCYY